MAKLTKKHFEGRSWYISFVAQVPANGTLACLDVLDDQFLCHLRGIELDVSSQVTKNRTNRECSTLIMPLPTFRTQEK